jgi:phage terminase large subunit GpA-like protein
MANISANKAASTKNKQLENWYKGILGGVNPSADLLGKCPKCGYKQISEIDKDNYPDIKPMIDIDYTSICANCGFEASMDMWESFEYSCWQLSEKKNKGTVMLERVLEHVKYMSLEDFEALQEQAEKKEPITIFIPFDVEK